MRLLAFSDIHHNLVAVRKLRASEQNSFEAIIVAGDIGGESAAEFLGILATFNCPVMYVYGNWDHEFSYEARFGRNAPFSDSRESRALISIRRLAVTGGAPKHAHTFS